MEGSTVLFQLRTHPQFNVIEYVKNDFILHYCTEHVIFCSGAGAQGSRRVRRVKEDGSPCTPRRSPKKITPSLQSTFVETPKTRDSRRIHLISPYFHHSQLNELRVSEAAHLIA
jgi:hypothetical protein